MLTFLLWQWNAARSGYTAERVNICARMIARHYREPHKIVCITDDPRGIECETYPLWPDLRDLKGIIPGTWCRLGLYKPEIAKDFPGRCVSLDLDCVITRDLAPLFAGMDVPFKGWLSMGRRRDPCIYNASIYLIEPQKYAHLWHDFNPRTSPATLKSLKFIGTEQAWHSYRLGDKQPAWTGRDDGVYSYRYQIRQTGKLPDNARIVFFHGPQKPWSANKWLNSVHGEECTRARESWIREHYR